MRQFILTVTPIPTSVIASVFSPTRLSVVPHRVAYPCEVAQPSAILQLCIPRRSKLNATTFPPAFSNCSSTMCRLSNSHRKSR